MRYRALETAHALARRGVLGAPGLSAVARRVRAAAVERAYAASVRRAARVPAPAAAPAELLERRSAARLERLRAVERPRILFVGTDEFQDRGGLIQGLESVGDVVVFMQADGTYGQARGGALSFDRAESNGKRLIQLVQEAGAAGRPFDLVVGQMWGGFIDVRALSSVREEHGAAVVNIAMDDRHTFFVRRLGRPVGTRLLAQHLDLAATTVPEAVGWYAREGCPAMFLPEASDPAIFRPDASAGKRFDVVFVGQRYGIRERLVARLRRAGVDVRTYGTGWPEGRAPAGAAPELLAAARIVLGVGTVGWSERLLALKMRDFDGPMSGSCYVTTRNPDLDLVYRVGEEIAVYDDVDDCVEIVCGLLADPARREAIARAGRDRASRDHTWSRRADAILGALREPARLQEAVAAADNLGRG